jgi:hypothetical protein
MRLVSRDMLLESVSAAVEATLVEFSGLPPAARSTLRREVQRRFLALSFERARKVRGLTREEALREFERAHAALSENHAETKKELAELEARLEQGRDGAVEPAPVDEEALARALGEDLEELLHAAPSTRETALERVVARERARRDGAIQQALAVERGKADLLERRVAKMRGELATMERAMAELERRAAIDGGVASIYKDVQGLSEAEPERDVKKALMQQIFEANVALQKRAPTPV